MEKEGKGGKGNGMEGGCVLLNLSLATPLLVAAQLHSPDYQLSHPPPARQSASSFTEDDRIFHTVQAAEDADAAAALLHSSDGRFAKKTIRFYSNRFGTVQQISR